MKRQTVDKLKLPDAPGVYFFIDSQDNALYIGKATFLRARVKSYFSRDIAETRGPIIADMVEKAKTVRVQPTDSVLEALLLEAELIKKYKPPYNTKEKDDKSFNYIVITKEDFPRVLLIRERELNDPDFLKTKSYKLKVAYGPFPQGTLLRAALKVVRKIFPFRDTCTPAKIHSSILENTRMNKRCFNAQIGLCPGVCFGAMTRKEYAKRIKHLTLFLGGKKNALIRTLEKEMYAAARARKFEKAQELKKTLFSLRHIQDISLIKNTNMHTGENTHGTNEERFRIEGYDIAHISGKSMVGVMTVVADGELEKNAYRKFKIKTVRGADDTASLAEVLRRRFGHPEWHYPRLIIVDGGMAQKNRTERVLKELGVGIPVMSVVKDERHRPRNILGEKKYTKAYEKEILLVNAEAHRFAIRYHRELRDKNFTKR